MTDPNLSALLEAIIYLADEPIRLDQIRKTLRQGTTIETLKHEVDLLREKFSAPEHGIELREIAGGYRFSTKPEHHDALKKFVKGMAPVTRLSLAGLETLAVIAYRQPITVPEILEIRGVQASGVIKTLLDRGLVTAAGRREVVGRPILYKTTRNFLVYFGLNSLDELPSVEEFEELIKTEHSAQAELPLELPDEEGTPEPAQPEDLEELDKTADREEAEQPEEAEADAADEVESNTEPEGAKQHDDAPAEPAEPEADSRPEDSGATDT